MARILIGVTGGISAYKSVELARLAIKAGHSVRVVQTPAARQFVGAATFEGITGAPVLTDEFEADPARGAFPGDPPADHAPISHLELVRRADVYAIVPASANSIAKLANGLADNLLTSAALASTAPLVVAPAMNEKMWRHPATKANVQLLRGRGAANVSLPQEEGIHYIEVETAEELEQATVRAFEYADVLVMAAAVADFRPAAPAAEKISKSGRDSLSLSLEPTT